MYRVLINIWHIFAKIPKKQCMDLEMSMLNLESRMDISFHKEVLGDGYGKADRSGQGKY